MSPHTRSAGGRRRIATRLGGLLAVTSLLAGCDGDDLSDGLREAFGFGIPDPISDRGDQIADLYVGSNIAALAVGVFVWGLIAWAVVRYRRRSDTLPRQVRYNLPIEVLYTAIPFVIIGVLFYYTVVVQNDVNSLVGDDSVNSSDIAFGIEDDEEFVSAADVNIGVIGFQWNWQFNYLDDDLQVTGETARPAQLVLPTDRTIRFVLSSPDVIHSFWVPAFLFKRDVIPGRVNAFEIELQEEGEFIGRCAEFCGERHAFMNFSVKVVSPEEYDAYVADLKANADDTTTAAGSNS